MEKVTIKLHKYQDQALFADNRFIAIISGIQGGKTFAGCVWSRMQFDQYAHDDGMIAAPTYKILQQSTLPKFFSINRDLKKYYKKGDSHIDVPGRGKIYIRSTEDPNSLEGMTLRWAWLDEGGQMKVDAWINVQGRLSILQGKCLITTTPYFFNWLSTDFFEQFRKGNKDYLVVQFRSIDSPYFPQAEYDRAKSTMDKRVFERRYMGLFTKMEGLVYDDFIYNVHTFEKLEQREFNQVIAGIDWGYNAPAAITVLGEIDGVFYLLDEFYQSKKITSELIEIAKNLRDKWKINRFYADTAEPDRIAEFNRSGLYTLEANKDVEWGVNKVRQLIKEGRFKVDRKCKFFLDEIERYHYPEAKDKDAPEVPAKEDDHAMDSVRYALATFQPQKVKKFRDERLIIKRHNSKDTGYSIRMA